MDFSREHAVLFVIAMVSKSFTLSFMDWGTYFDFLIFNLICYIWSLFIYFINMIASSVYCAKNNIVKLVTVKWLMNLIAFSICRSFKLTIIFSPLIACLMSVFPLFIDATTNYLHLFRYWKLWDHSLHTLVQIAGRMD